MELSSRLTGINVLPSLLSDFQLRGVLARVLSSALGAGSHTNTQPTEFSKQRQPQRHQQQEHQQQHEIATTQEVRSLPFFAFARSMHKDWFLALRQLRDAVSTCELVMLVYATTTATASTPAATITTTAEKSDPPTSVLHLLLHLQLHLSQYLPLRQLLHLPLHPPPPLAPLAPPAPPPPRRRRLLLLLLFSTISPSSPLLPPLLLPLLLELGLLLRPLVYRWQYRWYTYGRSFDLRSRDWHSKALVSFTWRSYLPWAYVSAGLASQGRAFCNEMCVSWLSGRGSSS